MDAEADRGAGAPRQQARKSSVEFLSSQLTFTSVGTKSPSMCFSKLFANWTVRN